MIIMFNVVWIRVDDSAVVCIQPGGAVRVSIRIEDGGYQDDTVAEKLIDLLALRCGEIVDGWQ